MSLWIINYLTTYQIILAWEIIVILGWVSNDDLFFTIRHTNLVMRLQDEVTKMDRIKAARLSFPSGHASFAFQAAGRLILRAWNTKLDWLNNTEFGQGLTILCKSPIWEF